jgi:phosphoesterase RecJ-like protein
MKEVTAALRAARRIALVSHRDPDPDTIGSALALGLGLESLGKTVSWHCADPVPEQQRFLHGTERFTQDPPPADVDLVVTVDFGSVDRAKFALPAGPKLVNIDHHASNDNFGTTNLVDVTAAASAELVSRVIDALGVKWTPEMATAALVGIMTDTGSFQFPSTDARALDRAARLREAGADLQAITYNIFRNKRFEALKLWGFAFSRLVRDEDGQLVWTELRAGDIERAGARDEDVSGLVEQVARSSGMRVALLFNEQAGGPTPSGAPSPAVVKVSCRTSQWEPSVDAAALMANFGGGGHVRAAGAVVPGDLEAVRKLVLQNALAALQRARARTAVSA